MEERHSWQWSTPSKSKEPYTCWWFISAYREFGEEQQGYSWAHSQGQHKDPCRPDQGVQKTMKEPWENPEQHCWHSSGIWSKWRAKHIQEGKEPDTAGWDVLKMAEKKVAGRQGIQDHPEGEWRRERLGGLKPLSAILCTNSPDNQDGGYQRDWGHSSGRDPPPGSIREGDT